MKDGVVTIDDIIPLKILPRDAARLCAIRAELDGLLITAVSNPESCIAMGQEDQRVCEVFKKERNKIIFLIYLMDRVIAGF